MSLLTPQKVEKSQEALHTKAKNSVGDRRLIRVRTCETPCPKAGCGKTARPV